MLHDYPTAAAEFQETAEDVLWHSPAGQGLTDAGHPPCAGHMAAPASGVFQKIRVRGDVPGDKNGNRAAFEVSAGFRSTEFFRTALLAQCIFKNHPPAVEQWAGQRCWKAGQWQQQLDKGKLHIKAGRLSPIAPYLSFMSSAAKTGP